MNPRDHPHGGGEGKAPIGGQPQTKWGKLAMGKKTRHRKATDKFIVRKRTQVGAMSRSLKKGPFWTRNS